MKKIIKNFKSKNDVPLIIARIMDEEEGNSLDVQTEKGKYLDTIGGKYALSSNPKTLAGAIKKWSKIIVVENIRHSGKEDIVGEEVTFPQISEYFKFGKKLSFNEEYGVGYIQKKGDKFKITKHYYGIESTLITNGTLKDCFVWLKEDFWKNPEHLDYARAMAVAFGKDIEAIKKERGCENV